MKKTVQEVINNHFHFWNTGDKASWMANWSDDLVMLDPVGVPEKQGRNALNQSWDYCFNGEDKWTLEPIFTQVCADQAAVHVKSHGLVKGHQICVESIEIYWVGEDGKINKVHSYFSAPDVVDEYFKP